MTIPMSLLAWTAFLGTLHAVSTGFGNALEHGVSYSFSPRDEQKPISVGWSRYGRAFANFMQTFPIFAAVVLIAHASFRDHGLATWGAQFYFWGRVVYVPLYVTGSKYRTYAFLFSLLGLLLIFLRIA
jgi:uncharacterized MAPEG superfamily protein